TMLPVLTFLIGQSLFLLSSAYFTPDFTHWLDVHNGKSARQWLERGDLHNNGSFGGRYSSNEKIHRNAVVFVHGVSWTAGSMMKGMTDYYKTRGYTNAELYGTTYDNPSNDPGRWMKYTMKCEHVKRIRSLISAVHDYTKRRVDVVAFSLGVPISRKAILGGKCVDSGFQLGKRFTSKIGTFVGVAGPNKGVAPVVGGTPFALCALSPFLPVCNPVDGLFSGMCPTKSKFLNDINRHKRYEGRRIFTIGSKKDEVVGHKICGEVTTRIAGQNGEKISASRKHDNSFFHSADTQIAMLAGQSF
ncbi:hypothetical protein PFISCL1PPCAC_9478, partial [Pristionchus fissidentatus]